MNSCLNGMTRASTRRALRGLLICGSAVLSLAAGAQESATVKNDGLDEVTVSARRQTESLMQVPVSANVVTGKALTEAAISNLTSLSSLVPGISFDKVPQSNAGSLTIRGIGSGGSGASTGQSVATVVDGLSTSRGGFLNAALFDVGQIEVLKGPQALFFGKDSPGGLVSIKSNGPTDTLQGYVNLGYESEAQERFVEAAISGPLTDTIRGRLAVRATDVEGWMFNTAVPGPNTAAGAIPGFPATVNPNGRPYASNASDNKAARLTLDFTPTDNFSAVFRYSHYTENDRGQNAEAEIIACPGNATIPVFGMAPDPSGDCVANYRATVGFILPNVAAQEPLFNNGVAYGKFDSYVSSLTLEYSSGAVDFSSITGVADYDRESLFVNLNPWGFTALNNDQDFRQISQEFRLATRFDSSVNFMFGLYYDEQEFSVFNPVINFALPADPRNGSFLTWKSLMTAESTTYSAFGEVQWKFADNLRLDVGVRYSEDDAAGTIGNTFVNANVLPIAMLPLLPEGQVVSGKRKFDNLSPQVTLTWDAAEDTIVFATWRNGYKSGNAAAVGVIPVTFNADGFFFRPEEIEGYEVGVKSLLLDNRLRLTASAFTYDYTDLQVTNFVAAQVRNEVLNAGGLRTQGAEIGVDYKPGEAFTVSAGVAYADVKYTDFNVINCFGGAVPGQGNCLLNGRQDLKGQPKFRAPEWTGTLNARYETPAFGDFRFAITAGTRFSSGVFTSENNNPGGYQKSYQIYDAGLHLLNDQWQIDLLGRNLGEERYIIASLDMANALPGTVNGTVSRPRQIWVQASRRF